VSRPIDVVVIHCSASAWGDVDEIRRWHMLPPPKGRGWRDVGYHYVIVGPYPSWRAWKEQAPDAESDGDVQLGRDLDRDGDVDEEIGAHLPEVNRTGIGICLVGPPFSAAQLEAGVALAARLCRKYQLGPSQVRGHREYASGAHKECPALDIHDFRRRVALALLEPTSPPVPPGCAAGP